MRPEESRFSYGGVLGDALAISWRNKFLWLLGLISAAVASSFSVLGAFSGFIQPTSTGGVPPFVQNNLVAVVAVGVLVALTLTVVSIFLTLVCSAGLTGAVAALDRGEASGFRPAWRVGLSSFWRLLLQTILIILISIALFLIPLVVCGLPVLLTFLLSGSVGLRVFVSVVFALLFVVLYLALVVPFLIVGQFAVRELVLNRRGAAESISSGYRLFRANVGRSLLLALINLGLALVVAVVSGVISFVIGLAFLIPSIGGFSAEPGGAATTASALGQLLAVIPTTLITALTTVFFSAFWTVAYLRVAARSTERDVSRSAR